MKIILILSILFIVIIIVLNIVFNLVTFIAYKTMKTIFVFIFDSEECGCW